MNERAREPAPRPGLSGLLPQPAITTTFAGGPPLAPAGQHLRSLTSLRFFAALGVMLLHVSQVLPAFPHAEELATTGQLGVTFFYLLSGFVLTWTFRPGDRAGGFYGRRFARVWPLHVVTTVLAGLVLLIVGGELNYRALPFVATMTHAFVPDPEVYQAFNTPSWSLSVEAFFYALFPLLIMVLARVRRPLRWATAVFGLAVVATAFVFAVAGTVAGMVGQSRQGFIGYTLYFFPPYRLAEFAIGMLIGVAVLRGWRTRMSLGSASIAASAALAVLTAVLWSWDHPSKMPLASLVMIPLFAVVVGAAATTDVVGRTSWLHHPALVVPGHEFGCSRVMGGWPPSAVCGR